MQKQSPLFSFLIKKIFKIKETWLGLIKPLSKLLIKYYFIAYNLAVNC